MGTVKDKLNKYKSTNIEGQIHSIKQEMKQLELMGKTFKGNIHHRSLTDMRNAWRKLNEQLKELQQEQGSLL